jgi:hypothetical protein
LAKTDLNEFLLQQKPAKKQETEEERQERLGREAGEKKKKIGEMAKKLF